VTSRRFARLVFKVLSELPDPFRQSLTNVDIVVKRRPGPADYRYTGAKKGDRLYGLYEGVPLGERGGSYGLVPPDKITLFSEPLERDFQDERELAEEIRKTVLHEIAHFFGMSEESVAKLGID
jgi:predicted Zn-dependent protease with MMP-like domain